MEEPRNQRHGRGLLQMERGNTNIADTVVAKIAALARIEDVSPHDLRHRFGYEMAKRVPLYRLAQIMGHDSLDTTMVYVRGTQGDLQRAVDEIAWA